MDMAQQSNEGYQLDLFRDWMKTSRPDSGGNGGTESAGCEERQVSTVLEGKRALATHLMERVADRANLLDAYRKVKSNKGAPGVDGMTVEDLGDWLRKHHGALIASLLDGSYQPQPVRRKDIPKPGGGTRQLGIPTVVDRLVQQAILQVLEPLIDPTFSESSYGFRPGRGAHHALHAAAGYVEEGRVIVVDLDLEKFFDRVNHDVLMARLARRIGDKDLLRIIRRFLEAGMMANGVCVRRYEGTPQGGPLSPLLANILLDDLDKELEARRHYFCRYADDCNIYVRSHQAGERVMASVVHFLEKKLRLKVNREKSAVAHVEERKFLGYRLLRGGKLGVAPKSIERMKDRIRSITRRNRGTSFERVVSELRSFLTGWLSYFRYARCRTVLRDTDQWLRHKLRCYRLKQCKRVKAIHDFLHRLGVPNWRAWITASTGKGWWRLAGTPSAHEAMDTQWFHDQGLISLVQQYDALQQ
jgi:RNA-directed DNA polymerase